MIGNADVTDSTVTHSQGALWYRLGPVWSLVSLLGIGLGAIQIRLGWQIGRAILLADIFTNRLNRLFAEVGGVGTHIGDVTRFIETLGHHHGLLDPEA